MSFTANSSRLSLGVVLVALLLGACAAPPTGDSVSQRQAQTAQTVAFGTLTDARPITVRGDSGPAQATGAIAGGVIGGLLGNEVGAGLGQDLATAAGATVGAAAGSRVAEEAGTRQSIEWIVQLENGQTMSVVQSQRTFSIGQLLQVIQGGGSTRIQSALGQVAGEQRQPSCLLGRELEKGLQGRMSTAENEVMHIVSALICIDGFEIHCVTDHAIFI